MSENPEIQKWFDHEKEALGTLADSMVFASIITKSYLDNPRCMLQLGAAICLNKPICLIVLDGCEVPPKLRGVADRIIRCKRDEIERASQELSEFVKGLPQ